MSATTDTTNANPEGRESNGRFAKGNKGGPGNPHARQSAELREAAMDAVSPALIQAILGKLAELALKGDVSAARLVLQYTLGKPVAQPHPDRLDSDEFAAIQANTVTGEAAMATMRSLPAKPIADMASAYLPAAMGKFHQQLRDAILAADAAEPPVNKRKQAGQSTSTSDSPAVVLSDTTTIRLVTDPDTKREQTERRAALRP